MNARHFEDIAFGMGCFWGAEKRLRAVPGVAAVEVGYAGGDAPRAGYEDVLREEKLIRAGRSQARNHAEVVRVRFDPAQLDLMTLLAAFWENHDPTQADGQGNDIGSNYRSAIYFTTPVQKALAEQSREIYQHNLTRAGFGAIATEIAPLRHYNRAEESHQDYLLKNPQGYCGIGGTGVKFGTADARDADVVQAFWKQLGQRLLSPEQQHIAFDAGTERPGTGAHLYETRPGTYFDPLSGAALFRSDAKFDSGCSWPSFFEPMPGALQFLEDHSHGMHRIEVRSASSGIHLGHVFDDGPRPTGKRYCINGNVLNFVPDAPAA